jgi:hypothetical protein
MNFFQTPIFLISFNRLDPLRGLVDWLEKAGYTNIHIVDNNSTYPPLLAYLARSPHHVHNMDKNYGHLVLWESRQFDEVIARQPFVLSDCDVIPDQDCPADVVGQLAEILARYSLFTKVGLSLRIDDLPDHYLLKQQVIDWESPFWKYPLEHGRLFEAAVDTTFAYYRPGIGPDNSAWWRALRTAPPMTARHIPWYADTANPSEEELYYQTHLQEKSSMWSITDVKILKEENIRLQAEVRALKRELLAMQDRRTYWIVVARRNIVGVADRIGLGQLLRYLRRKFYRLF